MAPDDDLPPTDDVEVAPSPGRAPLSADREAPEADALEQAMEVPDDPEY